MRKLWFKAKEYGWGWQPATWQGWAVLLVYAVSLVLVFQNIDAASHSGSDTLIPFFAHLIILTGLLIWVCVKTGERPTWHWAGKPASARKVLSWTAVILVGFIALMFLMKFVFMHVY